MQVLESIAAVRAFRKQVGRLGFVPTMGNLHDGHLSLLRASRPHCDAVLTSIFVNRLQFGPNEDFDRYPRTREEDLALLADAGCEAVFYPTEATLYPQPQVVAVDPPGELASILCGAFRPGHFKGVTTVVAKLFNIVQPDVAAFGLKDYQQYFLIRQMVAQLEIPVQLLAVDTGRAADGLALSSRNRYLSPDERAEAPRLYRLLQQVAAATNRGESSSTSCQQAMAELAQAGWQPQYLEVRDADTLLPATDNTRHKVVLAAAYLGKTRLIDNLMF